MDDATVVSESGGAAGDAGDAPEFVGNYRLDRELGSGGQSVVWLATDRRLGRQVALKVLRHHGPGEEQQVLRMRREASLVSRLDHPGICPVYEAGTDRGRSYIAMQYVRGRSLAQHIEQDFGDAATVVPAPRKGSEEAVRRSSSSGLTSRLPNALEFFESAARALHAAHEAGVIHRDVKPANIMVNDAGDPVILDFGLARSSDPSDSVLTVSGDFFGTPAYMSPEQARGDTLHLDRRADVYSLGATIYQTLAARLPFDRPTREALLRAIVSEDPPPLRERNARVSRELELVVATALEKDPARRYQTAEHLACDLARIRLRQPIAARPVPRWLRARRFAQRNPVLTTAVASILVLVSAVASILYVKTLDLEQANREIALERESARAALADVERLSDSRVLAALVSRAEDELWPAVPEKTGAMEAWVRDAEAVLTRSSLHRGRLTRLGEKALRSDTGVSFSRSSDAWQHEVLTELVGRLTRFAAADGELADVRRRLAFARDLKRITIDEQRARWDEAALALRAVVDLEPQLGLVPLGADPGSGLQEFLHFASHVGALPVRDEDGRLLLAENAGIVLVLIPPQTTDLGATPDPGENNHDPSARPHESPVHEVELDAFFIGKHEVTQAQWITLTGANPSAFGTDRGKNWGRTPTSLRQPVEQVSWFDCSRTIERAALDLATEAQWETACRAGSELVFSVGDEAADLTGYANVGDEGSSRFFPKGWVLEKGIADGHASHAPVGSYAANAFGLHDMHGNVWEWCRDGAASYEIEGRIGDGLREPVDPRDHIARGGSFHDAAIFARSAARGPFASGFKSYALGCRAARALE